MKTIVLALVVVAIAAAAIAAFAPATLADARLASLSGGALRVSDAQGTLWHGRGDLTSPQGRWRIPVEWVLRPRALLDGVAALELRMAEHAPYGVRGRFELGEHRVVADDVFVRAPGAAVAVLAGGSELDAGGDIELRSNAVSLAAAGSSGSVDAQWRNARIAIAGRPFADLGTLTSRLSARGEALVGKVSGDGGTLDVNGDVSIGATRVMGDLRLRPEAQAPADLVKALRQLGPADASGAFELRVDRSLR